MQHIPRTIIRSRDLALLCLVSLTLLAAPVAAQEIKPTDLLTVPPAEVVTPPEFEPPIDPKEKKVYVPFRPTLDDKEYARLKAEAGLKDSLSRMLMDSTEAAPNAATAPTATIDRSFEGPNQTESGGTVPPDTHGAAGRTQFVQVVNSRLAVFDKTTGNRIRFTPLNTFFGFPSSPAPIQARVAYDRDQGRWIVTARAFPESFSVQFFYIGVSRTEDATGEFFVYRINVRTSPFSLNDSFEYPQIGLDRNAVIITANIFSPPPVGFRGASMFAVPKNILYSGEGFTVRLFTDLVGTLTPPIVLDDNPASFLIANIPRTPFVALYRLTNSGVPSSTSLSVSAVNVGFYTIPRSARQPGTSATLDTLDTRFVNASTQIGDSLFNVHTIDFLGFPTPRWYEINTAGGAVVQIGIFSGAPVSDDWNASIAANNNREVFVTWSSSNQPGSREDPPYFPQMRTSGRLPTDPPHVITPGFVVFQSPIFYDGPFPSRWGEYSAMALDPSAPKCAWGVNEKVNSGTPPFSIPWGSRIFRLCFPE